MVSCCAWVASGAAAGCLPGAGRGGGGRWLVSLAVLVRERFSAAGVRRNQLLRVMMAPMTPVRMSTQPVTWRFRNPRWAVIAKAMMAPAATRMSDVAVFMAGDPFIKDGCEPGHLGAVFFPRAGVSGRLGGQGGGEPGEQDVEAAFEFGGAVVGGQDGCQPAEQGEFADRQAVQAEPQQVVGLVGGDSEFLQFVHDVA